MYKKFALGLIVMLAPLAGCGQDTGPMNGHAETFDRKHVTFGNGDLEARTRIEAPVVTRDAAGLLHVSAQIRNTTDTQLYVDCYIQFMRDGQPSESRLGPKQVTLEANLFTDVTFNSTQPATDYKLTFAYPRVND